MAALQFIGAVALLGGLLSALIWLTEYDKDH